MTTLNQIFGLIETFGTTHGRINKVLFGDSRIVDNESPANSIVMRYFPDSSSFNVHQTTYELIIDFMSQALDGESNIKDIFNDTHLTAIEFMAYMHYYGQGITLGAQTYDFTVDLANAQIFPFNDIHESNYWGHQILLRFNMPYDLDKCKIPGI